MKFKNNYALILIFFVQLSIFSQEDKITDNYNTYFEKTREIPYLHLNKTSFIKGEEVWFQAYVMEQNSNKLHPTVSNLYVSIFDDKGVMQDQKLVHVKDGIGKGNFIIDSSFTKRNYYLKASTKWMRNFNEDESFVQKIKVLGNILKENNIVKEDNFFEFKLFPEGGHLLANTTNNLGILIKNSNNKGIQITKGKILNQNNEVVALFGTNTLGLGKVNLPFKENQFYILEALLPNGSRITSTTPPVKTKGLAIQINDIDNYFAVNILTNTKTLKTIKNKTFKVFVHNTKKFIDYSFSLNNDKTYALLLKKTELFKGINIITVFNNANKPILERLIFNDSESLYTKVNVDVVASSKEFVSVELSNNSNETFYSSASFLPNGTKAIENHHTINSNMLLKPYIKGFIENPSNYFSSNNKNRSSDLDLLLTTQGWSKYSWNDIFRDSPTKFYEFETGVDISLNFNQKLRKNESIVMYSGKNNLVRTMASTNDKINLKNLFIKKGTDIEFGLQKNGNIFKISPAISYSSGFMNDVLTSNNLKSNDELALADFNYYLKDYEILEGIELTTPLESKVLKERKALVNWTNKRNIYRPIDSEYSSVLLRYDNLEDLMRLNDLYNLGIQDGDQDVQQFFAAKQNLEWDDQMELMRSRNFLKKDKFKEFSNQKFQVGFAEDKEYYSPNYPSYNNINYEKYGAILWKPSITIAPFSSIRINVPKNSQENIKMFIEGISESGKLMSTKFNIK